jgi:hypothetical protein
MNESKKQTIIVAPHPDDEIIGCYEILIKEKPIIIYSASTSKDRREESIRLKEFVDINVQLFLETIPSNFINPDTTIYMPDPNYEIHPLHRQWGHIGESIARSKQSNIIFYNTTMTAPYIHEVGESENKEKLLNDVYTSQKSLWEYEKKYILFEGYCKWIF